MSDSPKKDENTGSNEITGTMTDLDYSQTDAQRAQSLVELLGSRELNPVSQGTFLFMPDMSGDRADLLRFLKEDMELPVGAYVSGSSTLVLGPLKAFEVKTLLEKSLLIREDRLSRSFDRWKPIVEVLPEWAHLIKFVEETQTESVEIGDKGFTQTQTMSEVLEIEDIDDFEKTKLENPEAGASSSATDSTSHVVEEVAPSRSSPNLENLKTRPKLEPKIPPKPAPVAQPALSPQALRLGLGALIVVLVIVVGMKFFDKKESSSLQNSPEQGTQLPVVTVRKEWPASLQSLTWAQLDQSESPVVQKIRPILRAYEQGSSVLSSDDERLLRVLSDPASSSFAARKLASNQLAVYYLSRSDIGRARETLVSILQADPLDPFTLLNFSLIELADRNYSDARELASRALRLSEGFSWLSKSVLGMIEAASGRVEEAQKNFGDALAQNPNHPLIYGLWLQSLINTGKYTSSSLEQLLTQGLWADPDLFLDSPIPAPLAGHILRAESLSGYIRAVDILRGRVRAEKVSFVRWMDSRMRAFNPLGQSSAGLLEELSLSEDLQSQVLYAYVLKESERFDEASSVLNRVLPLITASKLEFRSSFPWSFAGDLQASRQDYNQAILYYQNALNKNSLDAAAVWGQAWVLREREQFSGAEQKLAEVLSINRFFIPARLRISRFEWRARVRGK